MNSAEEPQFIAHGTLGLPGKESTFAPAPVAPRPGPGDEKCVNRQSSTAGVPLYLVNTDAHDGQQAIRIIKRGAQGRRLLSQHCTLVGDAFEQAATPQMQVIQPDSWPITDFNWRRSFLSSAMLEAKTFSGQFVKRLNKAKKTLPSTTKRAAETQSTSNRLS